MRLFRKHERQDRHERQERNRGSRPTSPREPSGKYEKAQDPPGEKATALLYPPGPAGDEARQQQEEQQKQEQKDLQYQEILEDYLGGPMDMDWTPTPASSAAALSTIQHPPHVGSNKSDGESKIDRYLAAYASDFAQIKKLHSYAQSELRNGSSHHRLSNMYEESSTSQLTDSDTEPSLAYDTTITASEDVTAGTGESTAGTGESYNDRQLSYMFSGSTVMSGEGRQEHLLGNELEDDFLLVRQAFGYCSIAVAAVQLLILILQLMLCGVAPLDVNPMIGPFPDAFSEWQGKNVYFLVEEMQLWRLVTPAFLHVGVLHLLCNALVQLETCAFFEREWGSLRWIIIYLLSEVGCIVVSSVVNPETIAVGSSGALMGIFGAKFAQLLQHSLFEMTSSKSQIRLEQVSGIMCSLSIITVLSCITYIDMSGHAGGFATGFLIGMPAFSGPIRSSATRFLWSLAGLSLLGVGFYYAFEALFTIIEPDEDLADACDYFRNLYVEGYSCQCSW